MESFVKFENVTKIYPGKVKALDDVSFEIPAGSVFAILGPNGAGKTTTLKIMMGFIKATEGSVSIFGHSPFPDGDKEISFVPEEKNLYDWLTASKMKAYFSKFAPHFSEDRFQKISKRLDLTYRRRVKSLSQGNRTKLYLSLALSQDVKIYVLDEPTWGLDPIVRNEVLGLVSEIAKEGKTVIYSSHILSEVEEVCDNLLILKDGRSIYTGTLKELKEGNEKNFSKIFIDMMKKEEDYGS
ncbi:ABC transporter ATP-binding protein [Athalassotoga saccharophila]|uniref:ABC transporter ATP-binding protein n=1 Tax=Athalassotoga saccharophila TaxID=1441386 RepID=UPI00137B48CA|nr:ABC transporter ATP-binding protein [Athalassotoga saccharophila]BBJ28201.1 putative ABC transporter ATP-binding protein YadG [Athalassotoga saccharophila]